MIADACGAVGGWLALAGVIVGGGLVFLNLWFYDRHYRR